MARKKAAPREPVPGQDTIDLLIPFLTELGIEITRPSPQVLAGVTRGIYGERIIFSEIIGDADSVVVVFQSGSVFYDESILNLLKPANDDPECLDDNIRWMRITATAPRKSGGRHYMIAAKINRNPDGQLDRCREKLTLIIEKFRAHWPAGL